MTGPTTTRVVDADGLPLGRYTWVKWLFHDGEYEVMGTRLPERVAIIRNPLPGFNYTSTIPATSFVRHPVLWQAHLIPPRGSVHPRGSGHHWSIEINGEVERIDQTGSDAAIDYAIRHLRSTFDLETTWEYRPGSDLFCVRTRTPVAVAVTP